MIQYSGGPLVNRIFVPLTRNDWVIAVATACSDAGWTTISGTPTAGGDVLLETAANNIGNKIRFRFLDPGGANVCAQTTMKNVSGTLTSNAAFALPTAGSGMWRVIANKYHFLAFPSGAAFATSQRGLVFGGTLWVPTFLNLAAIDAVGWMIWSGQTDADTSARSSWRKSLTQGGGAPQPWWVGMWQANMINTVGQIGDPSIAVWQGGATNVDHGYRWVNGTLPMYEPFFGWGTTGTNEPRMKGQLYDALVVNGQWQGEATISVDGHTWMNITDGPTATGARTACLFFAVT